MSSEREIPGFEFIRPLGRGASSIVFEAQQATLQRKVAIKVLNTDVFDEATSKRFQLESGLLSSMQNEHIVSVFSCGVLQDGRPYLVLELVQGMSLAEKLQKDGRLDQELCVEIFSQVLAGLAYAHEKGIIHRDLKPGNIMLAQDSAGGYRAKLVDFGIAVPVRETDSGQMVQNLTRSGTAAGTPLYMSPEQCTGKELTAMSDIYSLGCVMYECLCGEPPFKGETQYDVMYKQVHQQPQPLLRRTVEVSPDVWKLVVKAMHKNPTQRFSNAEELAEDERYYYAPEEREKIVATSIHKYGARTSTLELGDAYVTLAKALAGQDRFDEAQTQISKAKAIYERGNFGIFRKIEVDHWQSAIYYQQGEQERALKMMRNSINTLEQLRQETDPTFPLRHQALEEANIGHILLEEGKTEEALKFFGLAYKHMTDAHGDAENQRSADLEIQIAKVLYILDRKSEAEAKRLHLKKLFSRNIEDRVHSLEALADLELMIGNLDDAKSYQTDFLRWTNNKEIVASIGRKALATSQLALIFLKQGKQDRAEKLISEQLTLIANKTDPKLWYVFMVAGEVALERGQKAKALSYLLEARNRIKYKVAAKKQYYLDWLIGEAYAASNEPRRAAEYLRKSESSWRKFAIADGDYNRMLQTLAAVRGHKLKASD